MILTIHTNHVPILLAYFYGALMMITRVDPARCAGMPGYKTICQSILKK